MIFNKKKLHAHHDVLDFYMQKHFLGAKKFQKRYTGFAYGGLLPQEQTNLTRLGSTKFSPSIGFVLRIRCKDKIQVFNH